MTVENAPDVHQDLLDIADNTPGFMPREEGLALYRTAAATRPGGLMLEIGSYCGKSTLYLAAAAQQIGAQVVTLDHHRGSQEQQPGEAFFDPRLFDEEHQRVDTLPHLAATLRNAQVDGVVHPIAGMSSQIARAWRIPLALVFIDGAHDQASADADLDGWTPHLEEGGTLVIHDVFPDPKDGGRPPYEIYRRALDSGRFVETLRAGSLRALVKRRADT